MKFNKFSIVIFSFVLICSMGIVCGHDTTQTHDNHSLKSVNLIETFQDNLNNTNISNNDYIQGNNDTSDLFGVITVHAFKHMMVKLLFNGKNVLRC